jgi:SAM-dependent methyltransferase
VAQRDEVVALLTDAIAVEGPMLDVGCGPGAYARELRGFVVGADLAPGMLEQASAYSGPALVLADLDRGLPFGDDAFAGVLALLVLQHVRRPRDAVAEIMRVVKPGGCVVVRVPAKEFGLAPGQGLYWRLRALGARLPGLIHHFSEAETRALVSGFDVLDVRRLGGSHVALVRNPEAL